MHVTFCISLILCVCVCVSLGFGMVKIDLRTKSCSGVEFSTSGHAYTDTGKASGNLETKYKICNYGLTFTQKWNTDNTLGTEISWENKVRECWKLFAGWTYPGDELMNRLCHQFVHRICFVKIESQRSLAHCLVAMFFLCMWPSLVCFMFL